MVFALPGIRIGPHAGCSGLTVFPLSDTYEAHEEHLRECRDNLRYVEGSCGLAVALGSRVSSVDVFDRPATCRKVWDRLLAGAILAALEVEEGAAPARAEDVERTIRKAEILPWEQFDPVGEGEEYRCDSPSGDQGAALVLEGVVVHGSLVAQE